VNNDNRIQAVWRNSSDYNIQLNQDSNTFKDFVTGQSGSVIDLVMKIKNIEYIDAVEMLIQTYNINVFKPVKSFTRDGKKYTYVTEYVYTDETGNPVHKTVRYKVCDDNGQESKSFFLKKFINGEWQSGLKDIERVPYNLPAVLKADELYFTEGEKACEVLLKQGLVATCICSGSNGWRNSYANYFKDKNVIIFQDNDEVGLKFAKKVADSLLSVANAVKIINPSKLHKGDAYEFFNVEAGTVEKLQNYVRETSKHLQDKRSLTSASNGILGGRPELPRFELAKNFINTSSVFLIPRLSWN
jgi:hypothetical protein